MKISKFKKLIGLLLVLSTVFISVGCNSGTGTDVSSDGNMDVITLNFANTQPEGDIETQALFECKKRIEEGSNGQIKVEIYPNSAMGDTDDLVEQAIQGMAVITPTDPARLASDVPGYGILQMPYFLPDLSYLDKIMDTDLYKEWDKQFEEKGIKVLTSNWYGGVRHFVLNETIDTPEDLSGIKVRTMGNQICIESINAMGAVATPMTMTEVYPAIEQKGLDGVENQPTSTYNNMLYEVLNTTNRTSHFILLGVPVMGADVFNSLSPEHQELLLNTFKEVGTEYQKIGVETEAEVEKDMESKGMTMHEVDIELFKEATDPLYDKLGYRELQNELYIEMGIK